MQAKIRGGGNNQSEGHGGPSPERNYAFFIYIKFLQFDIYINLKTLVGLF